MVYRLDFVKVTCNQAGADRFTGDDTFLRFDGGGFNNSLTLDSFIGGGRGVVFNTNPNNPGDATAGHPMNAKDVGFLISQGSDKPTTFTGPLTVVVADEDGNETADTLPFFFDFENDFIGAGTFVPRFDDPVGGQFETIANISGSGSSYQLDFQVTNLGGPILKPRHPNGKLASKEGGVLNGNNKAGTLIGFSGKDTIYGNDGDDILSGGGNNDTLDGGKGNDLILGGKGDDVLTGGPGHDTFVLTRNSGRDTITDFHPEDLLGLSGGLKFQELNLVKTASGTLIEIGNEQLALLQGVKPGQLSAANFVQIDLPYINGLMNSTMAALKAA